MSYVEYVAFERASDTKHEWVNGEVVAMAGGTVEHGRLMARVVRLLDRVLGDGPCELYSSDTRVRVIATGRATYPDGTVVCGPVETDPEDVDAIVNPTMLVEVLSPTTAASDRGDKWAHYQRIPSLRGYLMVDTETPRLELYARADAEATWTYVQALPGEAIQLPVGDARLAVEDVYRDPSVGG
jgi:Uma2 family endonuclease